jgi:hypothetical protein
VTWLIAGSVVFIAASATALVLGWLGANETFVWLSIFSSVGSAVCLALAYYRSRAEAASPHTTIEHPERVRVRPAQQAGNETAEMALFDEDSGMTQSSPRLESDPRDGGTNPANRE